MPEQVIKDTIHHNIVKYYDSALNWFHQKTSGLLFPFYSSFDLRDSARKITPVDANLFPAGFNNICEVDREAAPEFIYRYLKTYYPAAANVILLAEEHTHNPFYWDNVYTLKTLIQNGLRKMHSTKQFSAPKVEVCVPGEIILKDRILATASGRTLKVSLLKNKMDSADLVISNNDFSTNYDLQFSVPVIPPPVTGWQNRKKHTFFHTYNKLAVEFAELIHIHSSALTIQTQRFTEFNVHDSLCLKRLKEQVDIFLKKLQPEYQQLGQKPFVFLKNNSGTYGLGMTTIHSSEDIDHWNYKIKKKMKAAKGGAQVTELIIQEGISSHLKTKGSVSEPVIYLIGGDLVGGFLRTHKDKGTKDNLNSPGAVYRTLCVSDLEIEVEGNPMENVYGWVAYLGVLALAYETQHLSSV